MRIKLFILASLFLFFGVSPVFAGEPPTQINPENSSTVSSSKLEWQNPQYPLWSPKPYRVQVDDDSSFQSLNKDYYTDNTYYAPTLSQGNWFWRIKAKDISGTWSDWSSVWSFTLVDAPPSPTETPQPSPTIKPSPTPSPTHTPTPTKTPTPIPTIKPTPTPKKSQNLTDTPTPTPAPNPTPKNTPTPKPETRNKISYQVASVAAATAIVSQTATIVKTEKQFNPIIWVGLIFIFAGVSILGYIYIKKNAKIHFPFGK